MEGRWLVMSDTTNATVVVAETVRVACLDGVSNGALSSAQTPRKFEFSYNFTRGKVRDVRIRFQ